MGRSAWILHLSICLLSALVPVGPVRAETWRVHPDGGGDVPTIQAAIDIASGGDLILLTDGIFRGEGNRDLTWSGKQLTIRSESGVAQACVLDLEGTTQDPHRGFNLGSSITSATSLERFTITGGVAPDGAGLFCAFGAAPRTLGCILRGNTALGRGGALYCVSGSDPALEDCRFESNSALDGGAVWSAAGSAPSFRGSLFSDNGASRSGGAGFCQDSSPSFDDCSFLRNMAEVFGGALYCWSFSSPLLTDCVFDGNGAATGGGLALRDRSSPVLDGCILRANSATDAGAILSLEDSAPVLTRCSLEANVASHRAGAIFAAGESEGPSVFGCTIVGNRAAEGSGAWLHLNWVPAVFDRTIVSFGQGGEAIYVSGNYSIPVLKCCDLFGNEGGDYVGHIADQLGIRGNFSEDPLFCRDLVDQEPYSLMSSSPCAAENQPICGLIGAWDVACDPPTRTQSGSWGVLKALFR